MVSLLPSCAQGKLDNLRQPQSKSASLGTMKKISIVTSCYNERGNVPEFYESLTTLLGKYPEYAYEIIVADNGSTDGTRELLRQIASSDGNFKVLFNSNNFGPIRSGYNAFLKATGDAVVLMSSDFQDPPELVDEFIKRWREGYQVVIGTKMDSAEGRLISALRKIYYKLLARFSETDNLVQNFTGFGLYDRAFMKALQQFHDPIPYFRGFVSEIGFRRTEVPFRQPQRKYGRSKHTFLSLYSYAMTGLVNHSRLPLRLATFSGFCMAGLSILIAFSYLIYKLLYWDTFTVGIAPIVIGFFFFSAMQLIFIGIVGEYIGEILIQVKGRPLAIIEESINFEATD
jgi:glycosyltransferase involved in cell wall biosynthesis